MSVDAPSWLAVDWPAHTKRFGGINYVDIGAGPPLVFVHGLGGSWQNWLENLPFFARTHRCIAPDLPGFGRSDELDGDVSIPRFAQVVEELLTAEGIERCAVVGNSMGGFVALEMALKFPVAVDRLVLVSAAVLWQEYRRAKPMVAVAGVTEGVTGRLLAEAAPLLASRPRIRETALRFGGIRAPGKLSRELQRELLLTAKRTPGFLPALQALASYPLRDELPRIECPALIVWGDEDPLVGVGHAEELSRAMPDARVSIYERTGHVVQLERPERFNREVLEFLGGPPTK